MHKFLTFFIAVWLLVSCQPSDTAPVPQVIISTDVDRFWKAFDAIQTTSDSTEQLVHLTQLFWDSASLGQQRMFEARNYTPDQYLTSIRKAPVFWQSLRRNTQHIERYNQVLRNGIESLRRLYPSLRPSTVYYTMGVHRSPGTGVDSLVLIGTEYALGDSTTITSELNAYQQQYYEINPTQHLQLLIVHEYVHTQQKEMVHNLLSLTLYEGIAEYVAQKATQQSSPFKAFTYGPQHQEKIKARFVQDLFNPTSIYSWLWNAPNNEFQTSDLGYFIGYELAASYVEQSADPSTAITELIELDYTDEAAVERIVDATRFFPKPLAELEAAFENKRPTVLGIKPIANHTQDVDPNTNQVTIVFSEPMDTRTRGFDYGPLGEDKVLRVEKVVGFNEDGTAFTFEVKLAANQHYQSLVSNNFRSRDGLPLKPYLIDFHTGD